MIVPYVVVALFGLALGSFLNVCIFRLPQGESVVAPRSRCRRCRHPIRWYDNIPLISYLVLRGRCRHCATPISPIYPLVEMLTAALLMAAFAQYEFTPEFVKYSVLGMLLLVLFFTDMMERSIPHAATLFGSTLGLLLSLFVPVDNRLLEWGLRRLGFFLDGPSSSLLGSVAGAAVGGGLFYLVGEAFYRFRGKRKEYLGFGDVMLMTMIGSFLGIPLTLLTVFLGSLAGTLIALPLEILRARFRHYQWPYGSFLSAAAIFVSLRGAFVLEAYLRWARLG